MVSTGCVEIHLPNDWMKDSTTPSGSILTMVISGGWMIWISIIMLMVFLVSLFGLILFKTVISNARSQR